MNIHNGQGYFVSLGIVLFHQKMCPHVISCAMHTTPAFMQKWSYFQMEFFKCSRCGITHTNGIFSLFENSEEKSHADIVSGANSWKF